MTSILRDKSIALHESTDDNLRFQEGGTGETRKIAWKEELEVGLVGVDFTRTWGT